MPFTLLMLILKLFNMVVPKVNFSTDKSYYLINKTEFKKS